MVSGGWSLLAAGSLLMVTPVPVPLIGVVPFLAGCAVLSAHSKRFRRRIQALRHRFDFFSRWMERFFHRAPAYVRLMIRKTRPHAIHRQARIKSRGPTSSP